MTANEFAVIRDHPEYRKVLEAFASYPERSLLTASARAHLYYLIRTLDFRSVLEIGTYLAGTTELLARAVTENGDGRVVTLDPATDTGLVSNAIAAWPAAMQEATTFKTVSSGDFLYLGSLHDQTKFDLIFVDGNHVYDYALFDLTLSAKRLRPGGIMAIDNVEITGVYYALRKFLDANPNWIMLGASDPGFSIMDPGSVITKGPASPLYTVFMMAPETICVSRDNFCEFSILDVKGERLDALKIALQGEGYTGWLEVYVKFTNSFGSTMPPYWSVQRVRVEVPPSDRELLVPISLSAPKEPHVNYQHADIGLIWDGDRPLYITGIPELQAD